MYSKCAVLTFFKSYLLCYALVNCNHDPQMPWGIVGKFTALLYLCNLKDLPQALGTDSRDNYP